METALVVINALALLYVMFDKTIRSKKTESDKVDDRLITLLRNSVETLEKRVKELELAHGINVKEIQDLRTANDTLTKILQGRDEKTQKFQEEGFKAMERLSEIQEFLKKSLPIIVHA